MREERRERGRDGVSEGGKEGARGEGRRTMCF